MKITDGKRILSFVPVYTTFSNKLEQNLNTFPVSDFHGNTPKIVSGVVFIIIYHQKKKLGVIRIFEKFKPNGVFWQPCAPSILNSLDSNSSKIKSSYRKILKLVLK